jgi:hypothetical protein
MDTETTRILRVLTMGRVESPAQPRRDLSTSLHLGEFIGHLSEHLGEFIGSRIFCEYRKKTNKKKPPMNV